MYGLDAYEKVELLIDTLGKNTVLDEFIKGMPTIELENLVNFIGLMYDIDMED